ncbi:MAG: RHS repeat domain-containing protein, partial [Planctomycetota bacterium]
TGTTLPTSGTAALYYHRNQQYSIVALSDAAGTLVERYAYTAYGELTILAPDRTLRATSSFENRYTYTAREWDPTLRLYYFRARWLEPKAGRFIGRDPLGYVDGMGLYGAYLGLNGLDPTGTVLIKCECYQSLTGFGTYWFDQDCKGLAETCCKDVCKGTGGYRFTGRWVISNSTEASELNERGGNGIVRHWFNNFVESGIQAAKFSGAASRESKQKWTLFKWGAREISGELKAGLKISASAFQIKSPEKTCFDVSVWGGVSGNYKGPGPWGTQLVAEPTFMVSGKATCCPCPGKRFDILRDCKGAINADFGLKIGLRLGTTDKLGDVEMYAEGGGYAGGRYNLGEERWQVTGFVYGRLVAEFKYGGNRAWSQRFDVRWGTDVDF